MLNRLETCLNLYILLVNFGKKRKLSAKYKIQLSVTNVNCWFRLLKCMEAESDELETFFQNTISPWFCFGPSTVHTCHTLIYACNSLQTLAVESFMTKMGAGVVRDSE